MAHAQKEHNRNFTEARSSGGGWGGTIPSAWEIVFAFKTAVTENEELQRSQKIFFPLPERVYQAEVP
jgi:hypothetical protein